MKCPWLVKLLPAAIGIALLSSGAYARTTEVTTPLPTPFQIDAFTIDSGIQDGGSTHRHHHGGSSGGGTSGGGTSGGCTDSGGGTVVSPPVTGHRHHGHGGQIHTLNGPTLKVAGLGSAGQQGSSGQQGHQHGSHGSGGSTPPPAPPSTTDCPTGDPVSDPPGPGDPCPTALVCDPPPNGGPPGKAPEPGTLALIALGLSGIAWVRRRSRNR
jgi:hypothetical protein